MFHLGKSLTKTRKTRRNVSTVIREWVKKEDTLQFFPFFSVFWRGEKGKLDYQSCITTSTTRVSQNSHISDYTSKQIGGLMSFQLTSVTCERLLSLADYRPNTYSANLSLRCYRKELFTNNYLPTRREITTYIFRWSQSWSKWLFHKRHFEIEVWV